MSHQHQYPKCEGCGRREKDVKWAADVKALLCNACWVETPPQGPWKPNGGGR